MHRIATIVVSALLFVGAGSATNHLGKWSNGGVTFEFLKDGTALLGDVKNPNKLALGKWKPDDSGGFLIILTMLGSPVVVRGRMEGATLVTHTDTDRDVFKRMK